MVPRQENEVRLWQKIKVQSGIEPACGELQHQVVGSAGVASNRNDMVMQEYKHSSTPVAGKPLHQQRIAWPGACAGAALSFSS